MTLGDGSVVAGKVTSLSPRGITVQPDVGGRPFLAQANQIEENHAVARLRSSNPATRKPGEHVTPLYAGHTAIHVDANGKEHHVVVEGMTRQGKAKFRRVNEPDRFHEAHPHEFKPDYTRAKDVEHIVPQRSKQIRRAVRADDKRKTQGQTKTNFWDPRTGGRMSGTAVGQTGEKLFEERAKSIIEKRFGKLTAITSAVDKTGRKSDGTTPLDFHAGKAGIELKTVSAMAKNQKSAMKPDEKQRKLDEAARLKLEPILIIQVINQHDHTVELRMFHGFPSRQATSGELIGSYKFSDGDFERALDRAKAKMAKVASALGLIASGGWIDDATRADIGPGDSILHIDSDGVPWMYGYGYEDTLPIPDPDPDPELSRFAVDTLSR